MHDAEKETAHRPAKGRSKTLNLKTPFSQTPFSQINVRGDKKAPEELTTDLLTGIVALHTRLEKIDWSAISTDSRAQIQEAFSALTDAFTAINKSRNLA